MENILDDLKYRSLIKDFSNEEEIRELLSTPQTIYCGFDPSASSMHIGNFVLISALMRLQRAGHRIIAVVGGATGMIGDPSGKSKERNLQTKDGVKENTLKIKNQLERFLDLSDPKKGLVLNNYDWLSELSLLDYLRDYAKFFNVNYMLAKDIVSSRLEAGISLTEFCYMTLQSIDFLKLHKDYNCSIQIGGSDQWGNLTAGLDLIRKIEGNEAKAGCMTLQLITRSDGKKFGKSEDGALFLDPNLTSPYKLYQFFYNQSDDDAVRYLKIFTFLTKEEITAIEKEHYENLGARIAQKALAYEVTKIIHGENKAIGAKNISEALFSNKFDSLTKEDLNDLFKDYSISIDSLGKLEDVLLSVKVGQSKREVREFIKNNAISINGKKYNDNNQILTKEDTLFDEFMIIKRGKKNYYMVKVK